MRTSVAGSRTSHWWKGAGRRLADGRRARLSTWGDVELGSVSSCVRERRRRGRRKGKKKKTGEEGVSGGGSGRVHFVWTRRTIGRAPKHSDSTCVAHCSRDAEVGGGGGGEAGSSLRDKSIVQALKDGGEAILL